LIQEFAEELAIYGDRYQVESFKKSSVQLSSAAESFDIGECEAILNNFN